MCCHGGVPVVVTPISDELYHLDQNGCSLVLSFWHEVAVRAFACSYHFKSRRQFPANHNAFIA